MKLAGDVLKQLAGTAASVEHYELRQVGDHIALLTVPPHRSDDPEAGHVVACLRSGVDS